MVGLDGQVDHDVTNGWLINMMWIKIRPLQIILLGEYDVNCSAMDVSDHDAWTVARYQQMSRIGQDSI